MLKLLAQHLAQVFNPNNENNIVTHGYFDKNKSIYLIGLWR